MKWQLTEEIVWAIKWSYFGIMMLILLYDLAYIKKDNIKTKSIEDVQDKFDKSGHSILPFFSLFIFIIFRDLLLFIVFVITTIITFITIGKCREEIERKEEIEQKEKILKEKEKLLEFKSTLLQLLRENINIRIKQCYVDIEKLSEIEKEYRNKVINCKTIYELKMLNIDMEYAFKTYDHYYYERKEKYSYYKKGNYTKYDWNSYYNQNTGYSGTDYKQRKQSKADNKQDKKNDNTNTYTYTLEGALKIFNLDKDCTKEQIKSTYRKLVMIHHPDKGGITNNFLKLNAAYDKLKEYYNF